MGVPQVWVFHKYGVFHKSNGGRKLLNLRLGLSISGLPHPRYSVFVLMRHSDV